MNTVIINEAIVKKLESISTDIKYYINMNAGMSLEERDDNVFDDEDLKDLVDIRKNIRLLADKLKNKLNDRN